MIELLELITKESLEDLKAKDFPSVYKQICRIYREALLLQIDNNFDYISRETIVEFFKQKYPRTFIKCNEKESVIPRNVLVYLLKKYTTIKDIEMFDFLKLDFERSMCTSMKNKVDKAIEKETDAYMTILDHFNIEVLSI